MEQELDSLAFANLIVDFLDYYYRRKGFVHSKHYRNYIDSVYPSFQRRVFQEYGDELSVIMMTGSAENYNGKYEDQTFVPSDLIDVIDNQVTSFISHKTDDPWVTDMRTQVQEYLDWRNWAKAANLDTQVWTIHLHHTSVLRTIKSYYETDTQRIASNVQELVLMSDDEVAYLKQQMVFYRNACMSPENDILLVDIHDVIDETQEYKRSLLNYLKKYEMSDEYRPEVNAEYSPQVSDEFARAISNYSVYKYIKREFADEFQSGGKFLEDSRSEKESLSTRYALLQAYGFIRELDQNLVDQKSKHKVLSKVLNCNIDSAKKLFNATYGKTKWEEGRIRAREIIGSLNSKTKGA